MERLALGASDQPCAYPLRYLLLVIFFIFVQFLTASKELFCFMVTEFNYWSSVPNLIIFWNCYVPSPSIFFVFFFLSSVFSFIV